ncbi:MAG: DNA polymerase III subunit delta [Fermentimonas sp.]|jgi:DNA polymerase-3 subunit delta
MSKIFSAYSSLRDDILNRRFEPVYLFMGEESYFIDELTNLLLDTVLTDSEKDFNLHVFYGTDSDVNNIISASRRFPMMSDHQLVVVKEAQNLNKIELLDSYLKNVMPSTILVINYKHGNVDKRKSFVKKIDKTGVIFESKKLYDNEIPGFILSFFKDKKIDIDAKSAQMLADFVGNDISKLIPEFEKLELALTNTNNKVISPSLIEANVGISKDFNSFELVNALSTKDATKAFMIANHLGKEPIMGTVAVLFNYFSNLLECFWLKNKDERTLMNVLNIRSYTIIADYTNGLRNYNAREVLDIISDLRRYDARSKGVDNASVSQLELLRELVARIIY